MRAASAAAALLLLAAAPVVGEADCDAGGCDSRHGATGAEDAAALLQVSRKAGEEKISRLRPAAGERDLAAEERQRVALTEEVRKYAFGGRSAVKVGKDRSWLCPGWDVPPQSQVADFGDKYFNGSNQVAWWTTPQPPFALLEATRNQLTPIVWQQNVSQIVRDYAVWSYGGAVDVMNKMYTVTKARSTFDNVPEFLRGVFWMKGNALPEVLTVLQQGIWIEQENTFIAPITPFSWAWPLSRPANPPMNGIDYTDLPATALRDGIGLTMGAVALSYKFSSCPSGETYCTNTSASNDKAYAYMQSHQFGDIRYIYELGQMAEAQLGAVTGLNFSGYDFAGRFTLQALQDGDTTHWKRTCDWGISGCALLDFGSYDLVQVLDGDGQPVQPWYDQFLEFIGDVQIAVWAGFVNESVEEQAVALYNNITETYYQQYLAKENSQPWYSWIMGLLQKAKR